MDKFNFVRDGESKLPPGFRFQPTDEEIVFQYLARKTFSYPLPASVIPETNGSSVQIGKWILCHVFRKKRGTKAEVDGNGRRRDYDFMITGETSDTDSSSDSSSSSSCDSDSSVVSEVSSSTANSETNSGP
ncbi:NAC domain-containing protein 83 [Sesamum alatum]|uniref:NAC domain-containing protein 83 n=1 Tax=Sesamum alatum TaxID=300844 RepID=A0AAE1YV78_9LAMI|nr:NAC domain-containing protein 83 [Sesamum alatum]